jgi:hypothetical protein
MAYLKPVVAETSANLYTAAKSANLEPTEINQINQMSSAIKKHRELVKMDAAIAQKEFDRLDSKAQDQLKFLFKDTNYSKDPDTAADRVKGVLTTGLKIAASPLIGLFKLGGQYNRLVNTPYKVARQVAQGEDLFAGDVWTDAWNGTNMYDNGALAEVTSYFGKSDVYVAKGLLAGKTPGEILESYGKVDNTILKSIKKAYDPDSGFKNVLDGVKYAQISPGRDIARMLDTKPPASGGLQGDYLAGKHQNISGAIDFVYQIAVDPLTWLTGGLSKGVTKGDKIANSVLKMIDNGIPAEKAIEKTFQTEPRLYEFWDKGLGPALKTYSEAKGAAKSEAFNDIARRFPGYNNRQTVEALVAKDEHLPNGVIDAASAQKYFENAANLNLLLSGRVDGVTYMRNGVAVARSRRLTADGLVRYLDSVFNNTSKTTFAGAGRSVEELDKAMEPITVALLNSEDALQRLTMAGPSDLKVVVEANNEIKRWKKIGQLAGRSAAGLEVRVGKNAVSTAANFTSRARQILPKDMAEALTVKFLDSTMDEQVVILRNLDAATMYSMGLGGNERGLELMRKTLADKYGGKTGFTSKVDSTINESHAKFMPEGSVKSEDGVLSISSDGPIHNNQSTMAVGSLPYDEIGSMVWDIKSKKNIINAVGGATQGKFSKNIVDAWSILTLFPRLGIRSAIDEATMFLLTAPGKDLRAYAFGEGKKAGNVARTFTGSDAATGPIRKGIQKVFELGGRKSETVAKWGRVAKISPEDAVNIERRIDVIQALAKKLDVDESLLTNVAKREAIVDETFKVYGRYLDADSEKYLRQAFIHQPDALSSVANSIVARSGVSGQYGEDVLAAIIDPTNLDLAMAAIGVKFNKTTRAIDMASLSEREASLVHFDKVVKRFVGNKFKVDGNTVLNPADIFFRYDALRPGEIDKASGKEMFELALDESMRRIGFEINPLTGGWKVTNQKNVDEFLEMSATTVTQRSMNRNDADIARIRLAHIYADMFETFHGGSNKFNENLLAAVKFHYTDMVRMAREDATKYPSWNQAVARINIDEFSDVTEGYRLTGKVNSQLGVGDYKDTENLFRRYGHDMMEMMDNQVNGIFRQPAVMVAYTGLRKKYAKLEENMARQYYERFTDKVWTHTEGQVVKDARMQMALDVAQKHFTEVATREAADTILKFADNPAIRSNFSYAVRTMGRYYRATEDFYRRIYRMKDVSPRVLYRMRLAHIGLGATGIVHTDANNEPYVIMPMDNILFKATDGTIRALTGKSGYSQPQFNEFTLKLRMVNPSFSQDAGLPTLSGPLAGLSVLGFKNILGSVPGSIPFVGKYIDPAAKIAAEQIDTVALGNIGENMNVTRAIVPASLQKIWAILPFDEKSRQEATAAQQAMAYNAAHGLFLDSNSTEQEKADYLNNIRISAHNVIALRSILGLISPVAPTLQDSKGVPDYLKDVGITSLRGEFFDILNSISKDSTGDVEDPYELALATFTGKYPGKLVYTVSPNTKETKIVIKNTDGLKNWAIANQNLIKTYGEAAYIFAPQTGEFNAATYNWIKAAGLVNNKTLEKYYTDLLVAQDKQTYYDIARAEKSALSNESDPETRAVIINEATAARKALKDANPLLTPALIGQGNNIGQEGVLLQQVEQMISNPDTPVDNATRQRMQLAISLINDYVAFCKDPMLLNTVNSVELKAERKRQVEAGLRDLMLGDLYVTEANRAIFRSILGFYSRDSYYASKELR